jgi:hypothetical protein
VRTRVIQRAAHQACVRIYRRRDTHQRVKIRKRKTKKTPNPSSPTSHLCAVDVEPHALEALARVDQLPEHVAERHLRVRRMQPNVSPLLFAVNPPVDGTQYGPRNQSLTPQEGRQPSRAYGQQDQLMTAGTVRDGALHVETS